MFTQQWFPNLHRYMGGTTSIRQCHGCASIGFAIAKTDDIGTFNNLGYFIVFSPQTAARRLNRTAMQRRVKLVCQLKPLSRFAAN